MPVPADTVTLASDLRPALLKLARRVRQTSGDLSATDVQLIAIIATRPGVGVSELADIEQISAPSMSAHVKRLEASGWVTRSAIDHDRRRSHLSLTDAGRTLIDAVRRSRTDWLATRLARLDAGEQAAIAAAIAPLNRLLEDEA